MAENFYEMYLEEMGQIAPVTEAERAVLLAAVAQGEERARNRLVEGSLHRALELAKEYDGRELPISDLVQEANTALMLAAVEYDGSADWEELMEGRIREAVELALSEQRTELDIEENMAARVNVLQTVSQVLAKELGREATVEELAAKMKMTEDEIKDIMKLALDALTVNGEGQVAEGRDESGDMASGYEEADPGMENTSSTGNPIRDGWSLKDLL